MEKRFWISTLIAWLLFIAIDFLFHASILKYFWKQEIAAIKPLEELASLIPAGYMSILLLTILIGYIFNLVFTEKPELKNVIKFALIFGVLFSFSNFFGLFSFVTIPILTLALMNVVHFIEVFGIVIVYNNLLYDDRIRKKILIWLFVFIFLIICGIIIQNIF
jgi:hypothetical protein